MYFGQLLDFTILWLLETRFLKCDYELYTTWFFQSRLTLKKVLWRLRNNFVHSGFGKNTIEKTSSPWMNDFDELWIRSSILGIYKY